MPFIVTPLEAKPKQIEYMDILNDTVDMEEIIRSRERALNSTSTKTYYYKDEYLPIKYYEDLNLSMMVSSVKNWNEKWEYLFEEDRKSLYYEFKLPKKTGGWRIIDAPRDDLKVALRELKDIFELIYKPLYHTSSFAYIKGRQPLDCVKRHQFNKSWWFLKTDFSNFFGSSTEDFVWKMISNIFPFSEVVKIPSGIEVLRKALSLCFLSGGLPQGTPISPFLTNVFMIPIDFKFARDFRKKGFIYTRYADDIFISHKINFDYKAVVNYMREVLRKFEAPFLLKDEKTHYGSRSGRNWMLGVMLNKDNEITIGHKKKRQYKAMVHNYITSCSGGSERWTLDEIQYVIGLTSYYNEIEPKFIEDLRQKKKEKHGIDYIESMKEETTRGGFYGE